MTKKYFLSLFLFIILAFISLQANATTTPYNFFNITTNNDEASTIGSQFLVNVSDPTVNQVLFEFYNNVGIASSICDVYFDDGSLLGISLPLTFSAGVAFSSPATPSNLPGGNNAVPPFVTTNGFSADSDSPGITANGINNAGEWLGILFNLQTGKSYTDVINELNNGSLRIGIHVQAIGIAGGSDSFIHDYSGHPEPIPEPGTFLLLGTGLLGLAAFRYRRSKK